MYNFCFSFSQKVDEYGRDVYKLVKQFTNMARKEKELKEKSSKDNARRVTKKEDATAAAQKEAAAYAPLNVATAIQQQIKDFKVDRFELDKMSVKKMKMMVKKWKMTVKKLKNDGKKKWKMNNSLIFSKFDTKV